MSDRSQAEVVFFAALEKAEPAERASYLNEACAGNEALRRRVEALLAAHPQVGQFLERPVVEASALGVSALGAVENDTPELSFLAPSTRPDSLGRLGHYEGLEVLGQGGFGIVLRAFDESLQRMVAVKVLAPQLAVTSPARKRFVREARSAAQIRHENVVQVYAVEEQPLPYLVMEFIPGETLQQRCDRIGPLDVPEVLRIGRQIAEGLAAAHATGLIHRDVKPANVLIQPGPHEHVKLTDFGLARAADDASVSQSGMVGGTPMYMAPEQAQGDQFDHRADLFSLGSVIYLMCTGRPPFRAQTSLAVLKRVAQDTPRPIREVIPEVPEWLCGIVANLHAKDPAARFQTAREVADHLEECEAKLKAQQEIKTLSGEPSRVNRPVKRPTAPTGSKKWAAVAAALLLLFGGFGFTEATGVTDFRGTVIRLLSPEGTLVVEVDDPGVSVAVEGADVVIAGAGVKEIRLKTGTYRVEASKDGKVVRHELVTVTRDGRRVVRISKEAGPSLDNSAWETTVAALLPAEQVDAVVRRLKERNPRFDGHVTPTVRGPVVAGLKFNTDAVTDISPLRALKHLETLECCGTVENLSFIHNS